jgi:hypothetical protein
LSKGVPPDGDGRLSEANEKPRSVSKTTAQDALRRLRLFDGLKAFGDYNRARSTVKKLLPSQINASDDHSGGVHAQAKHAELEKRPLS